MCINPSYVWVERGPKWEQQVVACRQCWRCKKNRLNDYVARAMAEASTSQVACTVTLTYAPRDDLADKVITPHHFQLFMKLLRRAGHEVRYLVAGEYGDAKGRSHFHAILFFKHLAPLPEGRIVPRYKDDYPNGCGPEDAAFCAEIPQKRMVHLREWPHGHIQVDWSADERSIRYVCWYLTLEEKNNAWFSLSKKPPLGAEFFARKAAKAKELGVFPSSFNYLPPGGDPKRSYMMTGATRRDYLNAITQDAGDLPRMDEWVGKSFEKYARQRFKALCDETPPDELAERFAEMTEARQAQYDRNRSREWRRRADWLEGLLAESTDGILVKHRGKWIDPHMVPGEELKHREDWEAYHEQARARAERWRGFARSVGLDPVEDRYFLPRGSGHAGDTGRGAGASVPEARPGEGGPEDDPGCAANPGPRPKAGPGGAGATLDPGKAFEPSEAGNL